MSYGKTKSVPVDLRGIPVKGIRGTLEKPKPTPLPEEQTLNELKKLQVETAAMSIVRSLVETDTNNDKVIRILEKQGLVDKYPTDAEKKMYRFKYRLYWPRDKTIPENVPLSYYIIDFVFNGNLYIFLFPMHPVQELEGEGGMKIDHFENYVRYNGELESNEGAFTIVDALKQFAPSGVLTTENIQIFKEYGIIKGNNITDLDFEIKGHKITVLYSKESVEQKKVIKEDEMTQKGQGVSGDITALINLITAKTAIKYFNSYNFNSINIPGVTNSVPGTVTIIPKSDVILTGLVTGTGQSTEAIPMLYFNSTTGKLNLVLNLVPSTIRKEFKIDKERNKDYESAMNKAIIDHNKAAYNSYLSSKASK